MSVRAAVVSVVIAIVTFHAAPARAQADRRDPDTATLLSVGGTVAPFAIYYGSLRAFAAKHRTAGIGLFGLGTAALLVGPAAGHWYAGDYWTTGMIVRGSGLLGFGIGLGLALDGNCSESDRDQGDACEDKVEQVVGGLAIAALGIAAIAVGAGIDVARADDAAEAFNTEAGARLEPRMLSFGGQF